MSGIGVLIVDASDPWRRVVADLLKQADEVYTTSFASDGPEAVRKAVELRPDVIVMDVDLPTLNGTQAARYIRRMIPESKIVFLSSLSAPEVVGSALRAGGRGYVLKADAQEALLRGMQAVLLGGHFLSTSLSDTDRRRHMANATRDEP
jgi:DNA-binding NarL/FixJ family response regulator